MLQANSQQQAKMSVMDQNVALKIGQIYNQSKNEIGQKLSELHINLSDM